MIRKKPMFSALFGTILGILALIKKERKGFALLGLILNGFPLALFILLMIMMFFFLLLWEFKKIEI
jgi:ABC-type dipeptide/oligopeptide/nickel transport system permease component